VDLPRVDGTRWNRVAKNELVSGRKRRRRLHLGLRHLPVLQWRLARSFRIAQDPSGGLALVTLGIFLFSNATSYPAILLSQVIIAVGACSGFLGAGYIGGQWSEWQSSASCSPQRGLEATPLEVAELSARHLQTNSVNFLRKISGLCRVHSRQEGTYD